MAPPRDENRKYTQNSKVKFLKSFEFFVLFFSRISILLHKGVLNMFNHYFFSSYNLIQNLSIV